MHRNPLQTSRLALGEELDDLAVSCLGSFVVDEVPRTLGGREGVVGEVLPESVRPLDLDQGVFLALEESRGHPNLREFRRPVTPQLGSRLVYPDVPVEASLEVARFHEVVHPGVEVLLEDAGLPAW